MDPRDLDTSTPAPAGRETTVTRILPKPSDVRAATTMTTWSSFELPVEALREARHRILRIGQASVAFTLVIGLGWLGAILLGRVSWQSGWVLPVFTSIIGVTNVLIILACKSERVEDRRLVHIALVYLVLLCGIAGFAHAAHEVKQFGHVTPFGPYALAIAMFPLILPCPPAVTLVTALGATLAVVLGVGLVDLVGLASFGLGTYADVASIPLACSALAYGASRTVFGLQRDVAAARRLGSYELETKLGEGGMGEVWRARHRLLARPAAIKLIRQTGLETSPEATRTAVARFSREAHAIASLESPHTVQLFDFGVTDDGTFYYAMELLDGVDLSSLVRRFGPQPAERVREILLHVCDSLAEAHAMGLVHRDIKPANIMICRKGSRVDVVKVLDFGIVGLQAENLADSHANAAELTGQGAIIGTPSFMAPETLSGKPASVSSDIYSLGCVAYWLLTGRRVFEQPSPMLLVAAALRDPPAAPSALGFRLPRALEEVVLACLAKRPDERPASVDDFARRLAAWSPAEPWDAARARAWWDRHAPPRKVASPLVHAPSLPSDPKMAASPQSP